MTLTRKEKKIAKLLNHIAKRKEKQAMDRLSAQLDNLSVEYDEEEKEGKNKNTY